MRRLFVVLVVVLVASAVVPVAAWMTGRATAATASTPVVYIATGENFPDALGAGPAAAMANGPILLVSHNTIPGATINELNRLNPDKIIIVGGTGVISTNVQTALEGFAPTVERIAGSNRYETAAKLSEATFPYSFDGKSSSELVPRAAFVNAWDLPDGNGESGQTLMSTIITAPAPGVLLVNAAADAGAGAGTYGCQIDVDDRYVLGSLMIQSHDPPLIEEDCITTAALNVDAGTHTVELIAVAASVAFENGTLSALWIPFDGTGATP